MPPDEEIKKDEPKPVDLPQEPEVTEESDVNVQEQKTSNEDQTISFELPQEAEVSKKSDVREEQSTEKKREETRTILSQGLLLIFAGSTLASFIWAFSFKPKITCYPSNSNVSITVESIYQPVQLRNIQDTQSQICSIDTTAKDMITLLLSSVTTILGTALGFYFGSETTSQTDAK